MKAVVVENLRKEYMISLSKNGSIFSKFTNYFFPTKQTICAVEDISFTIKRGEKVAFIGPNGAGKSTTIKMLTGIIQPTSGRIELLQKDPRKNRKALSYEISAVFGQMSKLWYHLTVQESFNLLASIYDIPKATLKSRLNKLVEQFQIAHLLTKITRQLSLGERMRCEIVASFLHNPKMIFLDEPTIGLDVNAKTMIRDLLCSYSKEEGTTLLLTSHDTDDIETVCDRVIMLNKGKIILDDQLEQMKQYIQKKIVEIITEEAEVSLHGDGIKILEKVPHRLKIEIDLNKITSEKVLRTLLEKYTVKDFTVENPSLETTIKNIYHGKIHH